MKSPWYFNRYVLLVVTLVLLSISLYLSFSPKCENLFSSSGALITVAGLFLNIKHTLLFHRNISLKDKYSAHVGVGRFGSKGELTEEQLKAINSVLADEKYGVSFMITGTLIWAYGSYFVQYISTT